MQEVAAVQFMQVGELARVQAERVAAERVAKQLLVQLQQ